MAPDRNRMRTYREEFSSSRDDGPEIHVWHKDNETVVKWLASVRSPEHRTLHLAPSRPPRSATRAIITDMNALDWTQVHRRERRRGGNVWFTINRSPFIGKLSQDGKVTSYRVPITRAVSIPASTGYEWITRGSSGIRKPERNSGTVDPRPVRSKLAHRVQGNMAMAPDGTLWRTQKGNISHYDREPDLPIIKLIR